MKTPKVGEGFNTNIDIDHSKTTIILITSPIDITPITTFEGKMVATSLYFDNI
jgi:hypothetical protein